MTLRCKQIKPGDGGRVDGCGWQGPASQLNYSVNALGNCPACGSACLHTIEGTGSIASSMDWSYRNQVRDLKMKEGYEPKHLLGEMGQICEEAGEVLKHFGKILRFGIDNVFVDTSRIYTSPPESNRQAFYRELDDLEACIKRIKARHAANPEEQLGPVTDEQHSPYIELAQAAQEYLELLSDSTLWAEGVTRRGKIRDAWTKLNALTGVALARTQD